MHYASKAYAKTAKESAPPRELEASLLLTAAAKLQAVHDSWRDKPAGLNEALLYNRKLWTVFLDAVTSEENKLPGIVRDNLRRLGVYIMAETFSLMTNPRLVILDEATEGLAPLIRDEIWRCLEGLRAAGQSILVIDKNVENLTRIADRHYIIERGRAVWSGTSEELIAEPDLQHRYLGI